MKTWKVVDKYNPHKVWIIKRTDGKTPRISIHSIKAYKEA